MILNPGSLRMFAGGEGPAAVAFTGRFEPGRDQRFDQPARETRTLDGLRKRRGTRGGAGENIKPRIPRAWFPPQLGRPRVMRGDEFGTETSVVRRFAG